MTWFAYTVSQSFGWLWLFHSIDLTIFHVWYLSWDRIEIWLVKCTSYSHALTLLLIYHWCKWGKSRFMLTTILSFSLDISRFTCLVFPIHPPLFLFQVRRIAFPLTRFGNPVEMRAEMLTIIDAWEGWAYRQITMYVMVDECLTDLVPHCWHLNFDQPFNNNLHRKLGIKF